MNKHRLKDIGMFVVEGLALIALGIVVGRYLTLLEYEATIVRLRVQHAGMEPLDEGVQGKEDNQASKKTSSVKSESEEEAAN